MVILCSLPASIIISLLFLLTCLISGSAILSFTCNSGTTISASRFCDAILDCDDGSDEIVWSTNCPERVVDNKIGCSVQRTSGNVVTNSSPCSIDRGYFCNGSVACAGLVPCDVGCPEYYRCNDNTCVRRSTVCDGDPLNGCQEDDGWKSGIGFQCVRNGGYYRIPQQLLWDSVQDCDQGEDLCYITNANMDGRDLRSSPLSSFSQSRCFKCLDDSMIVPRHKVCDGVIDCSDLSDECLCDEDISDICRNVTKRESNINILESSKSCKVGQVACGDGYCIERSSVCDSIGDCHDNRDEKFSYCRGTLQCKYGKLEDQGTECRCDAFHVNVVGVLCDGNGDCPVPAVRGTWEQPPGFPADECKAQCSYQPAFNCTTTLHQAVGTAIHSNLCLAFGEDNSEINSSTPTKRIIYSSFEECDGVLKCTASGEDEADCPHRFPCKAGGFISIPRFQVCDGIEDCDDKTDENNITCPHRFFCKSRNTKVSIDPQLVCDFNINCDDYSDETNCSLEERFYCENGNPLFVEKRKMFDGRGDCTDMSDECPTTEATRNEDSFSSIYQLIANPLLRSLVWIMALLSIVGNGAVIAGEGKKLTAVLKKKSSVPLRTNLLLIFNLAVSDFLMGIYLLILGISGLMFDGVFCLHEMEWLTSVTCTGMGVLVVVSSEASVMTMVLLTSFRLCCVIAPFKATKQPNLTFVFISLGIVWVIALVVALIPLSGELEHIFIEHAVLSNNPFFRSTSVSFSSAKLWASKLLTFDPALFSSANEALEKIYGARNWKQLQGALANLSSSEYLKVTSYFGYYSANNVCVPRLFVTQQDKSWQFSLATTIFNFLCFCFVATAYLYIVLHQRNKSSNKKLSLGKEKIDRRMQDMQGKIIRLVATDFFCCIPISIMAFIHFNEGNLPSVAYVVSAIVLLPINSALNPLLYSDRIDALFARAKKRIIASQSSSTSQKDFQVKKATV